MPVWQARQLSYGTAKLIAEKGGVVGLWPMRSDVGGTPEAYAQRLWELGEWLGDDHAGFGTDMNAISRPAAASYADLQQVVRTSATEVFAEQRATNRANAAKALADLEKLGVKVNKIADAERAKWSELTAPLFAEFGAKSPETKVMIDKIRQLG